MYDGMSILLLCDVVCFFKFGECRFLFKDLGLVGLIWSEGILLEILLDLIIV